MSASEIDSLAEALAKDVDVEYDRIPVEARRVLREVAHEVRLGTISPVVAVRELKRLCRSVHRYEDWPNEIGFAAMRARTRAALPPDARDGWLEAKCPECGTTYDYRFDATKPATCGRYVCLYHRRHGRWPGTMTGPNG